MSSQEKLPDLVDSICRLVKLKNNKTNIKNVFRVPVGDKTTLIPVIVTFKVAQLGDDLVAAKVKNKKSLMVHGSNLADGPVHINCNHPLDLYKILEVVKAKLSTGKLPDKAWIFTRIRHASKAVYKLIRIPALTDPFDLDTFLSSKLSAVADSSQS